MVLECTDGTFRSIASMDVRRDELQVAVVCSDGLLESVLASFSMMCVVGAAPTA